MKIVKLAVILSCLVMAGQVYAKGSGPCKQYFKTCKESGIDKKGMKKCVTDAATADGDKGKACLEKMSHHKGH